MDVLIKNFTAIFVILHQKENALMAVFTKTKGKIPTVGYKLAVRRSAL